MTDNFLLKNYQVFRSGVLVGSPTGKTFSDQGLTTKTTYSYTVKAVDASGNTSPASNTATAKTL